MAESKAVLKSLRLSPRKVRTVVSLVKGKSVNDAFNILDYAVKRSALPVKKLLISAVANAKSQGLKEDGLYIKDIRVDQAQTLKRTRPASRGSAHPIKKRSSHIMVVLTTENPKPNKKVKIKKAKE